MRIELRFLLLCLFRLLLLRLLLLRFLRLLLLRFLLFLLGGGRFELCEVHDSERDRYRHCDHVGYRRRPQYAEYAPIQREDENAVENDID